ncbi:unnamed protein product [Didymodactylos carnosus]|uniref:Peptidase A2 domain-containing protein n=1 Tax=Didymodactylos carnosus TaxID=1234261 RepID=A0A8S2D9Z0_9BILA|nr:unnamed protein product [Didymodactylos carnosus]CAF3626984.1 unnamed protein product [Didymodactylos carnosus]
MGMHLTPTDSSASYKITRGCATTKGRINDINGILTIDTGAGVTIMNYQHWIIIGGDSKDIHPYSGSDIVGPEGSSIQPAGWIDIDITVAGQITRHPCILAQKFNQLILLGTDFLYKAGIILDIRGGRLWRKSKPVDKYLLNTDLYQAGRLDVPVYATEKRILPPYHETYISVRPPLRFSSDSREATTIPAPSRLSVANCSVVVHNNSTSLKIANLTPIRQIIYKGQRVANLDPWYEQWTTPSTGILNPQQHQPANKINDYINQSCANSTTNMHAQ